MNGRSNFPSRKGHSPPYEENVNLYWSFAKGTTAKALGALTLARGTGAKAQGTVAAAVVVFRGRCDLCYFPHGHPDPGNKITKFSAQN